MSELKLVRISEGYRPYDQDFTAVIHNKTITAAKNKVEKKITNLLDAWSYKRKSLKIKSFYIGKTHIRQKKGTTFDPHNLNTWKLDGGINGRYQHHVKEYYGNGGLVVVAIVTRESIPVQCVRDGYIIHQEEYALTLERRLIQHYTDTDKRLWNKTAETGKTDITKSIAYAIYVAFSFGKSLDTIVSHCQR